MLMKIFPGNWNNKLESMNMKVDEENGKASGMVQWIVEEHWLSCFSSYL